MGSLYGSHPILLNTKSSKLILPNTIQVNFNTKRAFTRTVHVKEQLDFKSSCVAFDGISLVYLVKRWAR